MIVLPCLGSTREAQRVDELATDDGLPTYSFEPRT